MRVKHGLGSSVPNGFSVKHTWIVTDRATGRAVLELLNPALAARVNLQKYRVQTALEYLSELNRKIKQSSP